MVPSLRLRRAGRARRHSAGPPRCGLTAAKGAGQRAGPIGGRATAQTQPRGPGKRVSPHASATPARRPQPSAHTGRASPPASPTPAAIRQVASGHLHKRVRPTEMRPRTAHIGAEPQPSRMDCQAVLQSPLRHARTPYRKAGPRSPRAPDRPCRGWPRGIRVSSYGLAAGRETETARLAPHHCQFRLKPALSNAR